MGEHRQVLLLKKLPRCAYACRGSLRLLSHVSDWIRRGFVALRLFIAILSVLTLAQILVGS